MSAPWEQRFWAKHSLVPTAQALAEQGARYTRRTFTVFPDVVGPCWVWSGCVDNLHGYGRTGIAAYNHCELTTSPYPHVIAWCLHHGQRVTEGYEVDHLCFVRACLNPEHLELVTVAENRRRRRATVPVRTWKRNHDLTGLADPFTTQGRCRQCQREDMRAYHAAHREDQNRKRALRRRRTSGATA